MSTNKEPSDQGTSTEIEAKHPLQNRWALWYLKTEKDKDWEDCLKMLALFDTVEDFWALQNHIQSAGELPRGSDYYMFKEGIRPMWEDVNNVQGGRWIIKKRISKTIHVKKRVIVTKGEPPETRKKNLDHLWLELLLAIVGEQFEDYGEFICGAALNVRGKGDKVSLWTRDATKDDVNLRIGQIMKEKLSIPDSDTLIYAVNKDSSIRTSSVVKPRISIPAKEVGKDGITNSPTSDQ
ncbi:unnamed protein product [Caenorhabditis angaria]|uniref:eIF-4F 25 kDa subunit n=1 Tax=Caenorhabditis angaria TaxID=860376 RepID=A0A9P1MU24_9PELO|nr:unnamed protein product [Caenorhabditis angaria]